MQDLVLAAGRDRSVRRRHPWVLSGAVAHVDAAAVAGDLVRVVSAEGEVLGFGHYSPESNLRVRLLAWGKEDPPATLLSDHISAALARRSANPELDGLDSLRIVNAEADGLPGLVVDRYGDTIVVKFSTAGMNRRRDEVVEALRAHTGAARGYERADSSAGRREGVAVRQGELWGGALPDSVAVIEGARRYEVDLAQGQQTGFYLWHRESRDFVERVAKGRRVLDLFAYTGGFSVAAAVGGARSATLVESSADALANAQSNLAANAPGFDARFERGDAFRAVRRDSGQYDLIVIDPPPLARARREVNKAARAYKDVLLFSLKRAAPGALVLTFSSSSHIDADLFRKITFGAVLDARRDVQVLRTLGPAVDHAVSIYHPEGAQLTGLLLQA
jgi:23S rRNA (cytosine1962-C5)-methyltransferase